MRSTHPKSALLSLQPLAQSAVPRSASKGPRRGWVYAAAALTIGGLLLLPRQREAQPETQIVSGAAKVRYTADGYPQRWNKAEVQLTIEAGFLGADPDAARAVASAVAAWQQQADLPRIILASEDLRSEESQSVDGVEVPSLQEADLVPDGKNTVGYRRLNIPGHKKDLALTIAYLNARTGEVVEADIYVNARREFGLLSEQSEDQPSCADRNAGRECDGRYDLQNVLTHELGHFYGLGEDVEDPLSTMYECTSPCETHKRLLAASDQSSVSELYLAAGPESGAAGGCSVRGRTQQAPIAWMFLAGYSVLALRRRTRS